VEEQMHGALDRGEFHLHYQPKVDVTSGLIIGAEALLRWNSPVLEDVYPNEFIPIAEQTGGIVAIGEFVLEEALRTTAAWRENGDQNFRIGINLSPRQFRDPSLIPLIEESLESSGVPAHCLELEITEGVLMSGHAYIDDALTALNRLGVELAMDDFGKGYSSLNYLRTYPFTTLKIDRNFIEHVAENPADQELVNATIAMAHGLGLKVVAEGVETHAQLNYLRARGCEFAQGYLFGRPVSPGQFSALLNQQNAPGKVTRIARRGA
jgi:EAL domain-containing protein (putative c-di-GMP-specific phosphodiesterase class I)